ncbi:hypothetical protein AT727_19700 [Desulfitobacterium hafniense]|uniref:MoaF-like domain-containing protein n=1 Tax=Desulfitobacterium hafniense TaxID=49338 RepID=A0A0W1JL04_DESHA|nr:hypothetical protein [Desulfitobacterium hafniense]KTE92412.1 hypothetical protein AT727_19700 [Desulfitobacterium hafniense]
MNNRMIPVIGHKFLAEYGMFTAELYFESETNLTFTILEFPNSPNSVGHIEKVEIVRTEIRPNVYMVTWQESTRVTVTDIEDFENGIVYTNSTTPEMQFILLQGKLTPME